MLGWPGHELQWGHDVGTRREDVARMYQSPTTAGAAELLDRYDVRWVVVGPIERAEYGEGGVSKWDALGERVYDRDDTIVWRLDR